MRVLIDTNLAFTYVTGREDPFASDVDRIMELCSTEAIEGVLAYHSCKHQGLRRPQQGAGLDAKGFSGDDGLM